MESLSPFIAQNLYLFAAFGAVSVILVIVELRRKATGAKALGPMMATQLINQEGTVVVDVRPAGEFKHGHIIGARNISSTELDDKLSSISEDKAAAVLLYCKTGMQAPASAKKLLAAGYTSVYTLSGGLTAWEGENMPLEKS